VARMGKNSTDVLVEESEGKRNLGRHRHRWKHKIIKDYREIKWEGVDNSHLAQEMQLAGCCERGDEPWLSIKCETFRNTFSRLTVVHGFT